MNTLKAVVIGLALMSGTTLVRADWNKTATDVMNAVNVGANPGRAAWRW